METLLSRLGWTAVAAAVMFALGYFKGYRDGRRNGGIQEKPSDEKQS